MAAALANSAQGATPTQPSHDSHQTVLLHEAIEALAIAPNGIYVDATFGRGGHSQLILQSLGPHGRLYAFDRDPQAIAAAGAIQDERFHAIHAPFSEIAQALSARGVHQIDGLLLDLGVSSPQLDEAARGFSFRADGPLDMRMDPTQGEPVSIWIARAPISEIAKVISHYGEERFAVPIANAIAARCTAASKGEAEPLSTTQALANLVVETLRRCGARREAGQHPATRTFQALRIHINREIDELTAALQASLALLRPAGRLVVITFHSLEDRIVKHFIRDHSDKKPAARPKGVTRGQHALAQGLAHMQALVSPQPAPVAPCFLALDRIKPSRAEVARNPRARSATLRTAQRQGLIRS